MTTRRQFLQRGSLLAATPTLWPHDLSAVEESSLPQSVAELWADFDPRRDPLEVEVIREWKEAGGVFRHVRFLIVTFKGQPARMAAIYGFPEGAVAKLPAVMHIHGGGQRGSLGEVKLLVNRGYAALSVNWGGSGTGDAPFNQVEGAQPGDPNTDWGAVDPSQLNASGYASLLPGSKQVFEDREHPKNNNWYLLTVGCRRGLTFLEQQPEVDPERLGVHGFSMGGNLTMYVAGTDHRVKAAVPAVGGQGWRWESHRFLEEKARPQDSIRGDVELFRRTLSFESYAPEIQCPVLHRSGTNDFHGWMDDVYRTNALIQNQPVRYAWTPHLNHRLSPEVAAAMPLWFDHFLKGGPALPETPETILTLAPEPVLRVTVPEHPWPVSRCEIYYSVDPDPRARFWRSAEVERHGNGFVATLPLHALDAPLFAFANVFHMLPEAVSLAEIHGSSEPVREICLSSVLHFRTAEELQAAAERTSQKRTPLVDDFRNGLRDWYQLNRGHVSLVQTWTRKLTDPLFRGEDGAKLRLTLRLARPNRLNFVIEENEWRNYRGPRRTYVCARELPGGEEEQSVSLTPMDFVSPEGPLASWREVDQFGICAHFTPRGGSGLDPKWDGPVPEFLRLEWA